ncbi:MAG: hypothetical protein U0892_19205 [Pirellulales bacterium]
MPVVPLGLGGIGAEVPAQSDAGGAALRRIGLQLAAKFMKKAQFPTVATSALTKLRD